MAVRLEHRGSVQVSMNLLDYQRTTLKDAYEAVRREAARRKIEIKRNKRVRADAA